MKDEYDFSNSERGKFFRPGAALKRREPFKTNDLVWIGCDDRTVEGWIILASGNSVSLMLGFEAILDGHVGMMPVLLEEGVYRSIVTGQAIALAHRTKADAEDTAT